MNDKAIVTLAIGKRYSDAWKESCEANWSRYANKNGYDLVCIDTPLDTSERARSRSPAWQKCLILSQAFATRYSRIVWVDADILINSALRAGYLRHRCRWTRWAPSKRCRFRRPSCTGKFCRRLNESRGWRGVPVEENSLGRQYYRNMGLPPDFDQVVQTAVLVLSPTHHRALLEKVYYEYEDKGGREFHMEMPPLSYELLRANAVHWIDARFNVNWIYEAILHYPVSGEPGPRAGHDRSRQAKGRNGSGAPPSAGLHDDLLLSRVLSPRRGRRYLRAHEVGQHACRVVA